MRVCPNNKILFCTREIHRLSYSILSKCRVDKKESKSYSKIEKPSIISGETLYYLGDASIKDYKAKNHNISLRLLIHTPYDEDLNTIHQEKRKDTDSVVSPC